jgi:hypothetical protein
MRVAVDCVIGTDRSIQDEAARIFAARLYRSLAAGFPVATAFEEAIIELELQGFEDQALFPQLWSRATVDPMQIFLAPGGPRGGEPRRDEAQDYVDSDWHAFPQGGAVRAPRNTANPG